MKILLSDEIALKLWKGDILMAPGRTLVNPLNTYLKLSIASGHVSSLIGKEAGPELQMELNLIAEKFNGHVPEGRVINTGPYGLGRFGFQAILHTATKNPGENYKYLRAALADIVSGTRMGLYLDPVVMPLIANHAGGVNEVDFIKLLLSVMAEREGESQHLNIFYLSIPEREKYDNVVTYLKKEGVL